jgi:hypothetical protein
LTLSIHILWKCVDNFLEYFLPAYTHICAHPLMVSNSGNSTHIIGMFFLKKVTLSIIRVNQIGFG